MKAQSKIRLAWFLAAAAPLGCNVILGNEEVHLADPNDALDGAPNLDARSPDTSGGGSGGSDAGTSSDSSSSADGRGGAGGSAPDGGSGSPDSGGGGTAGGGGSNPTPDGSTPIPDGASPMPDVSQDRTTPPTGIDGSIDSTTPPPPADGGPTCTSPQVNCGGKCVSLTDPKTCGSCTHDCTALPHVSGPTTCQAGACVVPPTSCATGFGHCSTNADDGCEVDISKPDHCGSCTACPTATPLCAQVGDGGTSSFQCKSQCAAPSPDLCNMSCVDLKSDPLNCKMCGVQCMPPTAHGTAVCNNTVCGFKCDSAYPDTCNSSCVNLNTDPANCGSCGGACVAPANGTVTGCANGVCQTACNTGYDKVGNQCSLIRFYIDATSGDDNALGTEAAPFKTWKKAATRTSVVTNPQIYFKTGVFDATAPGEDFTTKIPDGATVLTSGGKVTLTGNGGIGLPFAGSGTVNGGSTVDGLLLQTFSEPFSTTTGTQTLSYVTLKDIQTPMSVSSTSVTVDNFAMDSIPGSGVFTVQFGKLTLSNGTLSTRVALCLTGGPTPSTTNGSGSVVMTNVDLTGQLYLGIGSVGNALTNVRMSATCGGQNRALSVDGSASITLTNCSSTSPIDFVSAAVTSRGTTYSGVVSLTGPGPSPYDFGTAASKGNNTFNYGLKVIGDNVVANASGNKWIPSDGPADASGNISPQTLTGPYSNGMNVSIDSALSSVVF